MSEITRVAGCPTVDFAEITPVPCPCGQARRGFAGVPDFPGTIHVTRNQRRRSHTLSQDTYRNLLHSGNVAPDAGLELNGQWLDVFPGRCVVIPPGVRHQAVGKMKVLIVVLPEFDPHDEWFD